MAIPESIITTSDRIGRLGGMIAFVIEAGLVGAILRAAQVFHAEVTKVDALVSEYVRCRDFLLSTHKPADVTGWRGADGGAFREAWLNFNRQLEGIRKRFRRSARSGRGLLVALGGLALINAANWIVSGIVRGGGWLLVMASVAGALTALLLTGTAWVLLDRQSALMAHRTTGDYLIAPWPADGGTPEKQYAAFGKFLPVESHAEEVGPASEAL